jgi:hypothetical protein
MYRPFLKNDFVPACRQAGLCALVVTIVSVFQHPPSDFAARFFFDFLLAA